MDISGAIRIPKHSHMFHRGRTKLPGALYLEIAQLGRHMIGLRFEERFVGQLQRQAVRALRTSSRMVFWRLTSYRRKKLVRSGESRSNSELVLSFRNQDEVVGGGAIPKSSPLGLVSIGTWCSKMPRSVSESHRQWKQPGHAGGRT